MPALEKDGSVPIAECIYLTQKPPGKMTRGLLVIENVLQPTQRIPPRIEYIFFKIDPKGQYHIYNDGRTHGEK
jgi:hypothetical protein